MTILVCQKRHHEPHAVLVYPYWVKCDGLPQWPYARPKPPRGIAGGDHARYTVHNPGIAVYKDDDKWWVWAEHGRPITPDITDHETHAEAIQYAQKLVNERRNCVEGS